MWAEWGSGSGSGSGKADRVSMTSVMAVRARGGKAAVSPSALRKDAHAPAFPVVANVDAQPKTDAAGAIEALIRQVSSPVRWEDVVRRLVADGARVFVELGPGTVLSGLIKKIEPTVAVVSVENSQGLEKALSLVGAAD